jgi:hypothetical protein
MKGLLIAVASEVTANGLSLEEATELRRVLEPFIRAKPAARAQGDLAAAGDRG